MAESPAKIAPGKDAGVRRVALVIDDERAVSHVLSRLLRSLGFETVEAASAAEADEVLKRTRPDFIILDLGLPQVSGDEWLTSFRATNGETPVMIVTGIHDPDRKAAVLRGGADACISKPFDIVELEAQVCALLRRPRNISERALCGGLAHLNPSRSELRVGAVRHLLTQKEFGILWFLALHEENWVPASMLSDAVLGDSSYACVVSTRVHVFNLRQKLDYLSPILTIEAARNLGYRLARAAH
jgi:two-component system cell cycle response regulator CtrA